jgi:hypothetical protein
LDKGDRCAEVPPGKPGDSFKGGRGRGVRHGTGSRGGRRRVRSRG